VKHFRVFGSKCYIKREDDIIGKFDSRVDKGILVGYSSKRKAYKCFNLRIIRIVESINVMIDEIDGQNIKERRKNSVEQDHKEDLKEEEVDEESYEEEEYPKAEEEKLDLQVPPETPRK
jgi:hypothetical protein